MFGATGAQGGGVVSALLKGESYVVRAVTRNPDGEKGQDLKSKGCEVVRCDMDDKASVEEAVRGSYGVFLVTNYWEHFSMEKEIEQGKRVIDVSEALGVKHLIYSGLENVKKAMGLDCGKSLVFFTFRDSITRVLSNVNQTRVLVLWRTSIPCSPLAKTKINTLFEALSMTRKY